MEDRSQAGEFARLRSVHPQSEYYFVAVRLMDGVAMFVRCHAIETDFANQTTAAAIVTVPASKPIKAIIGNSIDPIALLRDAQHHGYKMLVACASCDRRKIEEKWWRTQSKSNPSPLPNSLLTGKLTGISVKSARVSRFRTLILEQNY